MTDRKVSIGRSLSGATYTLADLEADAAYARSAGAPDAAAVVPAAGHLADVIWGSGSTQPTETELPDLGEQMLATVAVLRDQAGRGISDMVDVAIIDSLMLGVAPQVAVAVALGMTQLLAQQFSVAVGVPKADLFEQLGDVVARHFGTQAIG